MNIKDFVDAVRQLDPGTEIVILYDNQAGTIKLKPENLILVKREVFFDGEFIPDESHTARLIIDIS